VQAFSLHPGTIPTDLARHSYVVGLFYGAAKPFLKSIAQGAATTIYCALDQRAVPGGYHSDCASAGCSKLGGDAVTQSTLWKVSEELCTNWLSRLNEQPAKL